MEVVRPDPPLNENVSRTMRRVRRRNTKPELLLRRELHRRGLRFRVDYAGLPGRPDVALTKVKIAVFVDGCFWHGCPIHATYPKHNEEWWTTKLARNRERDREVDEKLWGLGWLVLRYWTHDEVDEMADEIEDVWRDLSGLPGVVRE